MLNMSGKFSVRDLVVARLISDKFYKRCEELLEMPASQVIKLVKKKNISRFDSQCIAIIAQAHYLTVLKMKETKISLKYNIEATIHE